MYQYDILKGSFKNMTITYPLGMSNVELFLTNKMPHFTCNFNHICKRQSTYIWSIISMYTCFNILHTKTHKMVTKTQFPSKSHHNIALVPLNSTRQQIKSWSPPTSHNDKKWTTNSPP